MSDPAFDIQAEFSNALQLHQQGQFAVAEPIYRKILEINPKHHDALHLLGLIAFEFKNYNDCVNMLTMALEAFPRFPAARYNLGRCYEEMGEFGAAMGNYDIAWRIDPQNAEAYFGIASIFENWYNNQKALEWYDKALAVNPNYPEALTNRGTCLKNLKRLDEAIDSHNAALKLRPDYADAYNNRGSVLKELLRPQDAEKSYRRAIAIDPEHPRALRNLSDLLKEQKRLDEALTLAEKALEIDPELDGLFDSTISARTEMCKWDTYHDDCAAFAERITEEKQGVNGFLALLFCDSRQLQYQGARTTNKFRFQYLDSVEKPVFKKKTKGKLRVGYFSADFKQHPVSQLFTGVLEHHDKKKFETVAISLGANTNDKYQKRVIAAASFYYHVAQVSSAQLLKKARDMELDIAVDLNGFTAYARTELFGERIAPVQVNFLGYSATMGTDFIDYIIADKTIIPPDHQKFYSEKMAYMPHSFMPSDRSRTLSEHPFTRADFGLPETGFVYCAFNNTGKLNPDNFASWMKMLNAVEGSVLWLQGGNQWSKANLKKEAEAAGVNADRLVFAQGLDDASHYKRYRYADVFLDTLPYNAHTTANEALWAGLPVLTRAGSAFAGRVAASLVKTAGLEELIVETVEDYEAKGIELGKNPEMITRMKKHLDDDRLTNPLFDVERFTRYLEEGYTKMYKRFLKDLPPAHLEVKE